MKGGGCIVGRGVGGGGYHPALLLTCDNTVGAILPILCFVSKCIIVFIIIYYILSQLSHSYLPYWTLIRCAVMQNMPRDKYAQSRREKINCWAKIQMSDVYYSFCMFLQTFSNLVIKSLKFQHTINQSSFLQLMTQSEKYGGCCSNWDENSYQIS